LEKKTDLMHEVNFLIFCSSKNRTKIQICSWSYFRSRLPSSKNISKHQFLFLLYFLSSENFFAQVKIELQLNPLALQDFSLRE